MTFTDWLSATFPLFSKGSKLYPSSSFSGILWLVCRTEAHHSQSSYFSIIPPGGDISLTPNQVFILGKSQVLLPGFFPPECAEKKKKIVLQNQRGEKELPFWTPWAVYDGNRTLVSAKTGNSSWNAVFRDCTWWELGDVGMVNSQRLKWQWRYALASGLAWALQNSTQRGH